MYKHAFKRLSYTSRNNQINYDSVMLHVVVTLQPTYFQLKELNTKVYKAQEMTQAAHGTDVH
jgi:hypothetical protein